MNISQWACDRINGNTEGNITTSVEGYYHAMAGSIGTISGSISREKSFDDVMVGKLSEMRDSLSAVSLDEEMANLIKFQHAYSAAAKLISTADEMLTTLLDLK
jgi:flagellar hook-associated protein 1 FlgK